MVMIHAMHAARLKF